MRTVTILLVVVLSLFSGLCSATAAETRPNIVVIVSDELGYYEPGVELPKDRVLDGRDITPLLFDPNAGPVRDTHLYFAANQSLVAIRQAEWKLFLSAPAAGGKGKNGKAAQVAKAKGAPPGTVLYHLASDPGETKDVAADNPDIVARLQAEAARLEAEIKEHRRPAGQVSSAN